MRPGSLWRPVRSARHPPRFANRGRRRTVKPTRKAGARGTARMRARRSCTWPRVSRTTAAHWDPKRSQAGSAPSSSRTWTSGMSETSGSSRSRSLVRAPTATGRTPAPSTSRAEGRSSASSSSLTRRWRPSRSPTTGARRSVRTTARTAQIGDRTTGTSTSSMSRPASAR